MTQARLSSDIPLPQGLSSKLLDFYPMYWEHWSYFLRPTPAWVLEEVAAASPASVRLWLSEEDDAWGIATAKASMGLRKSLCAESVLSIATPAKGGGSFHIMVGYFDKIPAGPPHAGDVGRSEIPVLISYGDDAALRDWYIGLNQRLGKMLSIGFRQRTFADC